ncbi:MAG TPA: 4-hydroxy-tetrahydrodipicolinate synthase [Candidatus Acidoferrales bacterium]|nr:4-hydroxy-tetrahydrodipicolinate synthase [Candidatus Acidoferrales bacterium]
MTRELAGCGTALVTPFRRDGSVDREALERLVDFQLQAGVDFLVPCGTTGETPTLEPGEYAAVIRTVVERTAGRAPVVAGAGGNNTQHVIEQARRARELGADAILSVAPYYNRPTQEGLYQHFRAIAEAAELPVVLYNVPSRTGSNLEPGTVARLAEVPRIAGIKEASGNLEQQMELLRVAPRGFRVLSGDDSWTFALMSLGAVGVISVVSNEAPARVARLAHLLLEGRNDEARKLHFELLPLFRANFYETNPIPVKAAMAMMGLIEEVYRLPMVPMRPENRARLEQVLLAQGLLAGAAQAGRAQ